MLPGNAVIIPAVLAVALSAGPVAAFFHDQPDGQSLYAQHCASCHGAGLQGQPNWQSPGESGVYPAPPHDETGHTWHHDDAMLTDYITRGGQSVLDDMGVAFTSGMPGFADVLTAAEISAILDYIKSTWPPRIREIQSQR